ncbi:MAG: ketopantoate reductase family protein [Calditrichia bacterium]
MGLMLGISGVGSMASLFAAKLALTTPNGQQRPIVIGNWAEQIRAINIRGILLTHLDGKRERVAVKAITPIDAPKLDVLLILNKSWQTARVASDLAHCMSPDSLILTLQNGLGNDCVLRQRMESTVLQGITTEAANRPAIGRVIHAGAGNTLIPNAIHPYAKSLYARLNRAGLATRFCSDANVAIWNKLLINLAINPVTALFDLRNGEVLQQPQVLAIACAAAREAASLAQFLGIEVTSNIEAQIVNVCAATSENVSSMLQDVRADRPTEIESLCGAIVKLAQEHHLEVPLNNALYELLLAGNKEIRSKEELLNELLSKIGDGAYEGV